MKVIKGDLLELASSGQAKVIVHGCNCFHAMGSGIAGALAKRFPQIPRVDEKSTKKGDPSKLGGWSEALVTEEVTYQLTHGGYYGTSKKLKEPFTCINLYTQFVPGPDFIESVFTHGLKELNKAFSGQTLWFPKIGCGIGGGNWERVEELMLTHLPDVDVVVVVL